MAKPELKAAAVTNSLGKAAAPASGF